MMHKQIFKSLISLILTFALTASIAVNVGAVTPRWTGIYFIDLVINFDETVGNATGVAIKQTTATRIDGALYLFELIDEEWEFIDEWYNSKTSGTLSVSGDFVCKSGMTYRAVFEVTVYTGTVVETETVEYSATCP